MSLKDKFDKFIDYFTEDGDEVASDVVAARSEQLGRKLTQFHSHSRLLK